MQHSYSRGSKHLQAFQIKLYQMETMLLEIGGHMGWFTKGKKPVYFLLSSVQNLPSKMYSLFAFKKSATSPLLYDKWSKEKLD